MNNVKNINFNIYDNQEQAIKETFRDNYKNILVSCKIDTIHEFHETFKQACGFPDYYGMNQMAFVESFTEDIINIHDGNDLGLNLVLLDIDEFFSDSDIDFHNYLRLIFGSMRVLNSDKIWVSSWDRFALDCRLAMVTKDSDTIKQINKVVNDLNNDENINHNIRSLSEVGVSDFDIQIFGKTHRYSEYFKNVDQDYVENHKAWPKIQITIKY